VKTLCCISVPLARSRVRYLGTIKDPTDSMPRKPFKPQHSTFPAMIPGTRWRCLECALRTYVIRPEGNPLLTIAFHQPSVSSRRTFTSSPKRASKIGKAPLTIPAGVTFEILPPTRSKRKRNVAAQTEQKSTVHIKGPLGMTRRNFNGQEIDRLLQAK
jgi:hypothetical protein